MIFHTRLPYICSLITSPMRFLFEPDNRSEGRPDSSTRLTATFSHEILPIIMSYIHYEIQQRLFKPLYKHILNIMYPHQGINVSKIRAGEGGLPRFIITLKNWSFL